MYHYEKKAIENNQTGRNVDKAGKQTSDRRSHPDMHYNKNAYSSQCSLVMKESSVDAYSPDITTRIQLLEAYKYKPPLRGEEASNRGSGFRTHSKGTERQLPTKRLSTIDTQNTPSSNRSGNDPSIVQRRASNFYNPLSMGQNSTPTLPTMSHDTLFLERDMHIEQCILTIQRAIRQFLAKKRSQTRQIKKGVHSRITSFNTTGHSRALSNHYNVRESQKTSSFLQTGGSFNANGSLFDYSLSQSMIPSVQIHNSQYTFNEKASKNKDQKLMSQISLLQSNECSEKNSSTKKSSDRGQGFIKIEDNVGTRSTQQDVDSTAHTYNSGEAWIPLQFNEEIVVDRILQNAL
jgi:hypothetical protein